MQTEFGEKLQSAIESIEALTWKTKDGQIVKMSKATDEELNKWYRHCHEMLYNRDLWNPGKYVVRENIAKAWDSCNAELFVRYLLNECDTAIKTKKDILDYINQYKEGVDHDISNESIGILFDGLDPIYEKITVSKLIDACIDKLDIFQKKIITDKFILSQGIWLTDDEKVELTETDENGKTKNRLDVIKERLSLDPNTRIHISPTGLSFAELRSFVKLGNRTKISALPTLTLKVLRDKILLLLDNDLNYHINKWTNLMNDIKRVADSRNISLEGLTCNNG